MALLTLDEQIEENQKAITAVSLGQEYTMSTGNRMRKADLGALTAYRTQLLKEQSNISPTRAVYDISFS